jgi:hypothetical protein
MERSATKVSGHVARRFFRRALLRRDEGMWRTRQDSNL